MLLFLADYSQKSKGGSNLSAHHWMNKQNVVHIKNETSFSLNRKKVLTQYNMDEPQSTMLRGIRL